MRKQHCLKENHSSMGAIYSENFGGNMDCQKYVNISENNVNKIKEVLKNEDFNDLMIANINQTFYWICIFKIK